jgi:hypothetical protein
MKKALDIFDTLPKGEIFLIPVRIEECFPKHERLKKLNWADLFPSYERGVERLFKVLKVSPSENNRRIEPVQPKAEVKPAPDPIPKPAEQVKFPRRSKPMEVSTEDVTNEFRLNKEWKPLEYVPNEYVDNGDGTVMDRATGLMWQKSGSKDRMLYENAPKYIEELNSMKFAGYSDWRLPTVDELISLLEPKKQSNDLYISPIFDRNQWWCWSADTIKGSPRAWYVFFYDGLVGWVGFSSSYYVRGVRS